jgi:hypothetical protein
MTTEKFELLFYCACIQILLVICIGLFHGNETFTLAGALFSILEFVSFGKISAVRWKKLNL